MVASQQLLGPLDLLDVGVVVDAGPRFGRAPGEAQPHHVEPAVGQVPGVLRPEASRRGEVRRVLVDQVDAAQDDDAPLVVGEPAAHVAQFRIRRPLHGCGEGGCGAERDGRGRYRLRGRAGRCAQSQEQRHQPEAAYRRRNDGHQIRPSPTKGSTAAGSAVSLAWAQGYRPFRKIVKATPGVPPESPVQPINATKTPCTDEHRPHRPATSLRRHGSAGCQATVTVIAGRGPGGTSGCA